MFVVVIVVFLSCIGIRFWLIIVVILGSCSVCWVMVLVNGEFLSLSMKSVVIWLLMSLLMEVLVVVVIIANVDISVRLIISEMVVVVVCRGLCSVLLWVSLSIVGDRVVFGVLSRCSMGCDSSGVVMIMSMNVRNVFILSILVVLLFFSVPTL